MLSPNEVTVNVLTASGECARVHIANDQIVQDDPALKDYFSTFSAPPSTWWKDVRFACSGIQICTSREEADGWHQKHGFPYGDVITLDQLWKLSKVGYPHSHALPISLLNRCFTRLGTMTRLRWSISGRPRARKRSYTRTLV